MKRGIKIFLKIAVLVVVLSFVSFFIYQNSKESKSEDNLSPTPDNSQQSSVVAEQPPAIKYFSPSSDKITITALNKTLFTKKPTTVLSYYATDSSGQRVHFEQGDRAFVRILGITRLYTNNTEIFHLQKSGTLDDTLFSGNITILLPGKYVIKVCLGKSINLDADGNLIWPFGCSDSDASEIIDVYQK